MPGSYPRPTALPFPDPGNSVMRRGLLIALAIAVLGGLVAETAAQPTKPVIRMGVRVDARPFAWHDPANDSYLGFLVDLCTDAVARANYPFEQVPITAADRIEVLAGKRRDIDLLCDPTTINLARMDAFAALDPPEYLAFSPIVFVANGAYVVNQADSSGTLTPADPSTCLGPAATAPAALMDGGSGAAAASTPETTYLGAGFVLGTTIAAELVDAVRTGQLQPAAGESVCPVAQPSHVEGIAAFCEGRLRYYFGDLDIVHATVGAWREATGRPCTFAPAPRAISYEPYALVVSARTPGFRPEFVKALYEVFSTGTAEDRFAGHFEGLGMSPFLRTLFRVNRVPAGQAPRP